MEGVPRDLPNRELSVSMTFGVALLSILVQGLTMSGLINWLELAASRADASGL